MNPWTALMEPMRTRDNRPVRSAPARPAPSTFHTSDGLRFKAAAALVVTHGLPALVPIVVVEFRE